MSVASKVVEIFKGDLKLNKYFNDNVDYEKLDITNDIDTIQAIYDNHRVLQLRSHQNEKHLVVGCGNCPIAAGSHLLNRESTPDYLKNYTEEHAHLGCYTLNKDLGMNSSMIADFRKNDLCRLFKEGQFDTIRVECTGYILNTEIAIRNLIYLLKDGGYLLDHFNMTISTGENTWKTIERIIPRYKKNGTKLETGRVIDLEDKESWKYLILDSIHMDYFKDQGAFDELLSSQMKKYIIFFTKRNTYGMIDWRVHIPK